MREENDGQQCFNFDKDNTPKLDPEVIKQAIKKVKSQTFELAKIGTDCPVCTRRVQIYDRNIHSTTAAMLIRLHRLGPGFHHLGDFLSPDGRKIPKGLSGGPDFAKLRFWGLIESMPHIPNEKKNSGFWQITEKGKAFVLCQITVLKYVSTYSNKVLGFWGPPVTIKDCLGTKFNYLELMNRGYERTAH